MITENETPNPIGEITTAVIRIAPMEDHSVVSLSVEANRLREFASSRLIVTNDDVAIATDDLAMIAQLQKAIKNKSKEYVAPIKTHLDAVNDLFKGVLQPLEEADKITRSKIMIYRTEQARRRQEAEEINRQKEELARREAALNDGVITVDTTPVEVPEIAPKHIDAEAGSLSTAKVRKWEVVDLSQVPHDYLMIDAVKIGKVVRAGIPSIPGIRIWQEDTLRVNTSK